MQEHCPTGKWQCFPALHRMMGSICCPTTNYNTHILPDMFVHCSSKDVPLYKPYKLIQGCCNSAQLGATSTIPPSYIRIRAVVWAYSRGQTDRHTHTHTQRRGWPQYISRRLRLTRNVIRVQRYGGGMSDEHTLKTMESRTTDCRP